MIPEINRVLLLSRLLGATVTPSRVPGCLFLASAVLCLSGCADRPSPPKVDLRQALERVDRESLRQSVIQVVENSMFIDVGDGGPIYQRRLARLEAAGEAAIPILVEIIEAPDCPMPRLIGAIAQAKQVPRSAGLSTAIRTRRDERIFDATGEQTSQLSPAGLAALFSYFATYGDRGDVTWMEQNADRFPVRAEQLARHYIELAERRLAAESSRSDPSAEAVAVEAREL